MKCLTCGNELTTGDSPNSFQCRQCESAARPNATGGMGGGKDEPRMMRRCPNRGAYAGCEYCYHAVRHALDQSCDGCCGACGPCIPVDGAGDGKGEQEDLA